MLLSVTQSYIPYIPQISMHIPITIPTRKNGFVKRCLFIFHYPSIFRVASYNSSYRSCVIFRMDLIHLTSIPS